MEPDNNSNVSGNVNSPILKRKADVNELFNSKIALDRLLPYFDGDQKKLDRFKQTMIILAMEDSLRHAEPASILKCAIQAAEIGLPVEKSLGQVYFPTYKGTVTFSIGYKGWQSLAEDAQKSIKAHNIYDCDRFTQEIKGHNDEFELEPNFEERKESDSKWVLDHLQGVMVSILDIPSKVVTNKFVTIDKLKQLRLNSPAIKKGSFSPWTDWTAEMFYGKAIKYVLSKTPMSRKISRAIEIENEYETKDLLPPEKSFLDSDLQETVYD